MTLRRTFFLTVVHEGRLLRRDPVVLLMLVLAPVLIITVAGSALGNLYGHAARVVSLPLVDADGGPVARAIVDALGEAESVRVETVPDLETARTRTGRDGAPLALEIPAGTSRAIAGGDVARLVLHVDDGRRIEADAIELELAALIRQIDRERGRLRSPASPLPGSLDWIERPAFESAPRRARAFDQYVPGFGITFLLVGMMLGISLTLFDELEWGTLERLRASGVSLAAVVVGKVAARTSVGILQMGILFGVGRVVFDVSLGRSPWALLVPTASMSFAAAALGLVVPAIARTRDSVMPLGTMTSMTLSAVGGCWWPIAFEPSWMRRVADFLPTSWTMRAYDDLMIRGLPASAIVEPSIATVAFGVVVLAAGLLGVLGKAR